MRLHLRIGTTPQIKYLREIALQISNCESLQKIWEFRMTFNVEIRQSPKAYWEAAGLWDIYVEITHNGKLVASGSFDVETGEMGRNIYIYTPV